MHACGEEGGGREGRQDGRKRVCVLTKSSSAMAVVAGRAKASSAAAPEATVCAWWCVCVDVRVTRGSVAKCSFISA